jgi:hypothetical protein
MGSISASKFVEKNLVWVGSESCEARNGATNAVTTRYYSQGVQMGANNYFYTRDHLGSIRELTDSAGVVGASGNHPIGSRFDSP